MIRSVKTFGIPLSRNEMKQLSGGLAPAASQYSCNNGGTSSNVLVCVGGGASPTSTCGFISCSYVGTCTPPEETCGAGGA